MTEPTANCCSQCGLPIPRSDLGDRCPNCLLELALTPLPDDIDGEPETTKPFQHAGIKSRFFADYEILEEIARGGMGVVYRARQLSLNRIVALKLIQPGLLSSPDALLRFQIEVRAIAQLNHSNIVSLYEAGEHDGQHYFSMSLVAAGDLSDRIRAGEFRNNPRLAAALLAKVARAVHYAHQRGILHRDLKPSNILLDERGEPHVTDFGLAKTLERDSGLTRTESVVGSPNYMAPEQAAGRSHEVTIAADVYSLGAILYQMLADRPPFQANTALETMRLVADEEPISPRRFNSRITADLETICLKCLRKEPKMRYGTAEELAVDLELWLRGLPIHARRIGALGSVWLWARRHPAVAALGIALALALIGIAVGSSLAAVRVSRAERKAVASLRESLLNQARLLRLSGEMGQRSEGLRLLREASAQAGTADFRDRLRDELLATLALSDMPFVPQPQLRGPLDHALTVFDPSFERQASIVDRDTVVIRRTSDGQELRRFAIGEPPVKQLEQFSRDGRYLGMRHPDGISVWDTETGQCCFATNGPSRVFTFSPSQPVLILEEWQCQVSFRRLPGAREIRRIISAPDERPMRPLGWSALAVSRNGQRLAAVRAQNNIIELYDLTVEPAQFLTSLTNSAPIVGVAWNPRQSYLAAATSDRKIVLWNPYSGQVRGTLSLPAPARSIAYSHDGTLLGAACEDRVVRLWQSHGRQPIFSSLCDGHRVGFSLDGQRLGPVIRGGAMGWLELARPAEFVEGPLAGSMTIRQCEFSPDGRIVGGGWADLVGFANAVNLGTLERLPVKRPTAFRFDPRGTAIFGSDAGGVGRWTMRWTTPNTLKCLLREDILTGPGWSAMAFSAQGDWFAAANARSNAAFVFDCSLSNCVATLASHAGVDSLAISPDARWLATGSSGDRQVKVWDVRTREELLSIHAGVSPRAAFSADGKWLATFGDTFELRAAGSWKPAPPLPFRESRPLIGAASFSHDSRLLAIVNDQYAVHLFDVTTFQSLGVLRAPEDRAMYALAFSQDGGRLAAACSAGRLRVWDLRLIRQRLNEFNLDWDVPSLPPSTAANTRSLSMDVPP